MLVVIGATDFELGGLGLPRVRRIEDLQADAVGGRDKVAIAVGIGGKHVDEAVRRVAVLPGTPIVLNLGFAGALAPDLSVGAPLLIGRVQAPDSDLPPIEVESGLLRTASRALEPHGARIADLVTVPYMATFSQQKSWLRDATNADAVDMEGYWVAAAAKRAGIAVVLLKVISDTAQQDLPASDSLITGDRMGLAVDLAAHPWWLVDLLRLARTGFAARRRLGRVGNELADCLLGQSRAGTAVA